MSITITNKNIGSILQEAEKELEKELEQATIIPSDIGFYFVDKGELFYANKYSSKEIKEKALKILEKSRNELEGDRQNV